MFILILTLANLTLGHLLYLRLPRPPRDGLTTLLITFGLGTITFGSLLLLLAEWGFFSIPIILTTYLTLTLLLALMHHRTRQPWHLPHTWPWHRRELLGLTLYLCLAIPLYFRPHPYIHGAADAGVYLNWAAHIAHNGQILVDTPLIADLPPDLYPHLLRPLPPSDNAPYYLFPGFYAPAPPATQITPQFYPLHTVWLALAYLFRGTTAATSLAAALTLTPFWILWANLTLYLIARHLTSRPFAALALLALSLNALQIWFARYPTTEPLTQFLIWLGLWATLHWLTLETDSHTLASPIFPLLAGLALGQTFLVRIDTFFLLALPFGLFLYRLYQRHYPRTDVYFHLSLAFMGSHSLRHALTQSAPYFFNTFGHGLNLLQRNPLIPTAATAAALLALALPFLARRYPHQLRRLQQPTRSLGILLILSLALYGAVIRPYGDSIRLINYWYTGEQIAKVDPFNVPRLAWYLSPLGLALATLGTVQFWRHLNRATAMLVGTGLFFTWFYLWRLQANPHQIYSMRRYLPVALPYITLAATYALYHLQLPPVPPQSPSPRQSTLTRLTHLTRHPATSLTLATLWLASLLFLSQGFVRQVDYPTLPAQIDTLATQFTPNAIILFSEAAPIGQADFLGTPLRFIYQHNTFALRTITDLPQASLATAIHNWQEQNHDVYWVVVPDGPMWPYPDWPLQWHTAYDIEFQALEGTVDRRPTTIQTTRWTGDIYLIPPS